MSTHKSLYYGGSDVVDYHVYKCIIDPKSFHLQIGYAPNSQGGMLKSTTIAIPQEVAIDLAKRLNSYDAITE